MLDTVLGVFFTAAGAVGMIESVMNLTRGRQSHDWHLVPAEIVDSRVTRTAGGHGGGRFVPVVEYRYSINGATYTGRRVQFTRMETPSREVAERVVGEFQTGSQISVRVSPSDPRVSVIQPGPHGRSWLHLLFWTAFTSLGIASMVGALQ